MRQSLLYFIAAALFAIATALNFADDGINLKTGAGIIFIGAMVALGLKARREGK
jgi:hypothetical protein